MRKPTSSLTRRSVLGAGLGLGGALALGSTTASAASAGTTPSENPAAVRRLRALEREHQARIGVFALNLATGASLLHRAHELFPMCSVFKTLAAAAVLRDLDHDGSQLARVIRYTEADVTKSGHAPVTKDHIDTGMTIRDLCDATIRYSDNCAANLLLRELGGPTAVTRFCRSLGDPVTRLDRWEPELNSGEPDRRTDTTSPYAIARTYQRLVLGNALNRPDRALLTDWLLRNTTTLTTFRTGLPKGWTVADKSGGGDTYGTRNEAAIAWTPDGAPVLLTALTHKPSLPTAPGDTPLIIKLATVLSEAVAPA
ncbi:MULTISPECIES: class A beta-lactamase [Streptomyces]|uniref:Beta-lactamase n=3 Tax=Streptomyces TaxID=1883 RepID=BLAC_STRCE|nr:MULTISPECIES: class A beta-lactamase [Streptomyces]Q06650.1 RecName: Full=Beta-lactamase; AltName: Full=Penicillinase; Flags: Precursor [Streptomyces cellulosae]KOG71070.1 beta-lactamase [Kitasatospora aureofaciens]MYT45781.1 class A beta-lactamase [Streptomyces sp. SID5471]KEF02916.1 beta-lactamase [Streptomyces rimosus]KOT33513.1 beta-lactamase [Streptomyces sp. NRRL WC-3701]KOT34280.1 beta-lactamase [Streptomyces rimosus subsp. rimosus]